jgi:8-oxo-dGTP pyrophosphatase MutT (NUDIX family)
MARSAIPTWFFALLVVRKGNRFLVVQEAKHGQLWYLPAGRIESKERIVDGAIRETLEEAGVPVHLDGILRIEHGIYPDGDTRVRVFFLASPIDDTPPKNYADSESLQAAWVTLEELKRLPLRGEEMLEIFEYVAKGGPVYPLSLLVAEGSPWKR